jgi:hypothetical protein
MVYSQVESVNKTIFCGNNSCNIKFERKKLEKNAEKIMKISVTFKH